MAKAACVLVLGALFATACQRPATSDVTPTPADLALRSSPADLAPPTAVDLAPATMPDLLPLPENITICPQDQQTDSGTNTVVHVHATANIDQDSLSAGSFVVQLGTTPLAGAIAVSRQELVFTPTAPLPANAVLQATLAAGVLDTLGRPLAPAGRTWTFSTGAGALPMSGFAFTPPISPYLGDHSVQSTITRDGAQSIIAWSTGNYVVATSLNADATDFVNPLTLSHADVGLNEVAVAAVDGVATFAYAMTVNSPLVYWGQAHDDWQTPAQEQLLTQDESFAPSLAVATGGRIAIGWDYGDVTDGSTARVMTSADNGATFTTLTVLPPQSGCPQLLYQNGLLVVAWLEPMMSLPSNAQPIEAMISADNGATFSAPVIIAQPSQPLACPQLVDGGNGDVLVLYNEADSGGQAVMLGRYTPASGAVATPVQLYAPDPSSQCAQLAASPSGQLVLAHSRGGPGLSNWTTELRTSDDFGQTFGAGTSPEVIDALGLCPSLTLTDDAQLTMAWQRDSFLLQVSRGHPKRPCE